MNEQVLIIFLGGTLLLLYGVNVAGEGLKKAAGRQIKNALSTMTRNRFLGLLTGIIITFLLQSSSATTVMLVSFVDTGMMQVMQCLGVILGADIGTTLTVQLISFRLHNYAMGIVGLGLLIMFLSRDENKKAFGQGIFGFGLIFLSIGLISDAMSPLKDDRLFQEILLAMGKNHVPVIILSALLTGLIQASAATIALAISLSINNLIGLDTAILIVLGANIGTASTAVLASLRSKTEARQVAVAHIFFKLIGALLFLPFLGQFQRLVEMTATALPHQVANAHTLFNCIIAIAFLPFTGVFYRVVKRITPAVKEQEPERFGSKYLNPELFNNPALAVAAATREAMRMAEIVQDMLSLCLKPFLESCPAPESIEDIEQMDNKVDILDRDIRFYLTQLSRRSLSGEEAQRQMEILHLIHNLENIGDVIDKNLMELAKKKCRKEVSFSQEGEKELKEFHQRIYDNFILAMSAFTTREELLAQQVIGNKKKINDLEQEFYQNHLHRLELGLAESFETSRIHLDVLSNLKRINSYITNIAYPIAGKQHLEGSV